VALLSKFDSDAETFAITRPVAIMSKKSVDHYSQSSFFLFVNAKANFFLWRKTLVYILLVWNQFRK